MAQVGNSLSVPLKRNRLMKKKIYMSPGVRSLQLYSEGYILNASELPGGGEGELDAPKKEGFHAPGWLKKTEAEEKNTWQ